MDRETERLPDVKTPLVAFVVVVLDMLIGAALTGCGSTTTSPPAVPNFDYTTATCQELDQQITHLEAELDSAENERGLRYAADTIAWSSVLAFVMPEGRVVEDNESEVKGLRADIDYYTRVYEHRECNT